MAASLAFAWLGFHGCAASGGMLVPGQNRIILQNLSIEYYNVAEAYFNLKNYSKAIEYYKLAMRDENLYTQAYYKLGRSYALGSDWNNAMKVFEDLKSRDPENSEIEASIAYINVMSGNIDAAAVQYRDLIEKYPNEQTFLENYLSLLLDTGRGELAEKQYVLLKERFPDSKLVSSLSQRIAEIVDNAIQEPPETKDKAEGSK
jgi:tetratricopeptide (TPR) repeat protein